MQINQPNLQQQQQTSQSLQQVSSQVDLLLDKGDYAEIVRNRSLGLTDLLQRKLFDKDVRLVQSLTYFKEAGRDQQQNYERIEKLSEKWSLGAEISQEVKIQLIYPLVDQLNLDVKSVVELCDLYFQTKRANYENIVQSEQTIANIQKESNQQIQMAQNASFVNRQKAQLDGWSKHLKCLFEKIVKEVKLDYFLERNRLLNLVMQSIITSNENHYSVGRDLLRKQNAVSNIIKSLVRNVDWEREFAQLPPEEKNQQLAYNIYTEQIILLQTLIAFWCENAAKKEDQEAFLEFLNLTNFQGKMRKGHMRGETAAETFMLVDIKVLSQLAGIAMMGFRLQKPQYHGQMTVEAHSITQSSSFVYFPMTALTNQTQKYAERFSQLPLIEEFTEVLNWTLKPTFCCKAKAVSLLNNWLNMLYDFESSKRDIQRNQTSIDQILHIGMSLLKDQSAVANIWKEGIDSLRIYKEVLDQPFENFERFLTVLCKLCGSVKFPHADKVMEYIVKKNLWPEIFGWVTTRLQHFCEKTLDQIEIIGLIHAVTMIAKMIRQVPGFYLELQTIYSQTEQDCSRGMLKLRFDRKNNSAKNALTNSVNRGELLRQQSNVQFETGEFPLVRVLVKAMHFFFDLNFEFGNKPICKLLEAVTKVYKIFQKSQPHIIRLLYQFTSQTQGRTLLLIEQMADFNQPKMEQLVCFFKFLRTIFKQEDPFSALDQNDIYSPDRNILCVALNQIYLPIVQEYQSIQFQSEKERSAFMNELFRLTYVLLSKFDQIRDDGQKVLLQQQTPYFDYLLQVLSTVLNLPQVNHMCLQAIQVIQTKSFESSSCGYVNYFESICGSATLSRHFMWMVSSAIEVLNKILELALTSDQLISGDAVSVQTTYILNMQSISDLKKCISDNTTLRMEDQSQLTIPALVAYYITPSGSLAKQHKIRSSALKFLTQTFQIQSHTNALTILKNAYGQNFTQQLSFVSVLNQEQYVTLSNSFLDFYIEILEKQSSLAEEIFQAKDSKALVEALQNPFQNTFQTLTNSLKHKICILLSLMSTQRCCTKVLDFNSQQVIQKAYDCVVQPLLDEVAGFKFALDGNILQTSANSEATVLELTQSFDSKIVVYYYTKLLQSEFEREPSSKTIRYLIEKLYANKAYQSIAIDQNQEEAFSNLFEAVKHTNDNYLRDNQSRLHNNTARLQSISRIQDFEARFQRGKSCPLYSSDGSVFLSSLNGKQQFQKLEITQPHRFYNSALNITSSSGMVGAEFVVDVKELRHKLNEEGYNVEDADQVCAFLQEFNLALSSITLNYFLLKAKADFILSVGQTQLQVVQRHDVPSDLILASSILPLATCEENYPKKHEQIQQFIIHLAAKSIAQIKVLQSSIQRSTQRLENQFLAKHLEAQVQLLLVHLGLLGHLVSDLVNDNQLSREIPIIMGSLLGLLPNVGLFKNDSKDTHVLFCQIVTLILQIQVTFGQKCQQAIILQSFGQVIEGMQRGYCMTEGIQIFILICDMIEPESLVLLMNRQTQGSPLQLLISRITDPKVSNEEMQLILTLLQSFASSEEGSESLHKNKIVSYLISSQTFSMLNAQDPYVISNQEHNRNQTHTWWLQVLVLIRQMNANLIRNPRVTDSAYFREVNKTIKFLQSRFQSVLQVNLVQVAPSARSNSSVVSIAILEEIELLSQILSQMFQHADYWYELDKSTYIEMKDLMLFAVPKVFNNCVEMRTLLPSSVTERHLLSLTVGSMERQMISLGSQNERTALQLKMEMSLVKALMACTASLHNIVTLQKQSSQSQMIQTWGRIDSNSQSNFEQAFLNQQVREPFMQFAFENFLRAMQGLKELYKNLKEPNNQTKKLVEQLASVFLSDSWIQSEYQGGLASVLIEESFDELIENIEVTLGMGIYVLSGLLEQISGVISGVMGFTGGSAYGGKYATHYNDGQIEERHLVLMAKNLALTVRQLNETVQSRNPPWSSDSYLKAILDYTETLTNYPTGNPHFY